MIKLWKKFKEGTARTAKKVYQKVRPPLESREYRIEQARKVSSELVKECGDMVEAVFVAGSVAKNRQRRQSDLDLLVVLDANKPTGKYYDFVAKTGRESKKRFGFYVDMRHLPKETLETLAQGGHYIDGAIGSMILHGLKPVYTIDGFLEKYKEIFRFID